MSNVCRWCGQPLDYWGEPQEGVDTCYEAYDGDMCGPELAHHSQLIYEAEQHKQEDIDEYHNQRMEDCADALG